MTRYKADSLVFVGSAFGERPHRMLNTDKLMGVPIFLMLAGSYLWFLEGDVGVFTAAAEYVLISGLVMAPLAYLVARYSSRGPSKSRYYWVVSLLILSLFNLVIAIQFGAAGVLNETASFTVASLVLFGLSSYFFYWWFRWTYFPPKLARPVVVSTPTGSQR